MLFFLKLNLIAAPDELKNLFDASDTLRQETQGIDFELGVSNRSSEFKRKLKEWIESEIPKSKKSFNEHFLGMQEQMISKLKKAGLMVNEGAEKGYGFIGNLDIRRPAEVPDLLVIIAGITVPCGIEDSIYIYKYEENTKQLLLEDNPQGDYGETLSQIYFSPPDENGDRLFLSTRYGVQCASCWNALIFSLYRLDANLEKSTNICLEKKHGEYWCSEARHIQLKPDDLLIELQDESIFPGFTRTHVLHYKIGASSIERITPIALRPQDFVDEWLNGQWNEMERWTCNEKKKALKDWHQLLHSEPVFGEFRYVQQCPKRKNHWQICAFLDQFAGKDLNGPVCLFFHVQQKGLYDYEMMDVNVAEDLDCAGEDYPDLDYPSLFKSEEKQEIQNDIYQKAMPD